MPGERVLIVDDEADVLDLCRRMLEAEGYQVATAHNGWEAIERARTAPCDLLLTDIKMPGLSGLETAQTIKEIDPNVVCVTMTGYSTMNMAIEALRLGIDEFIVKPFTPDELVSSVAKALEKVRLRRENIRLRALIPLFELSKVFLSNVRETEVLEQVARIAQNETRASGALIFLADAKSRRVLSSHASGTLARVSLSPRNTGWLFPWIVIERAEEFLHAGPGYISTTYPSESARAGAGSLLASPLMVQDQPIGALIVSRNPGEPAFELSDAELLVILAGQAAIAISNARLFTEIERAYTELKRLDHMKSEFINIAAHELRTPLAILMGYASILEEESSGETRERLEIVVRNAMRLRSIIDDMLNLRHLETGQATFCPESFTLGQVAEEVIADLQPLAREKGLQIISSLPPALPQLFTDRKKVEIVLANLLSNAIKFTPAGGRIELSAAVQDGEMIISLADTGQGIPADALEKIFEPFFQVEDSLTREHGGIGLGLTIARGMVERCGGRIWAESVLGQGSRFSFSLPLRELPA